MLRKEFNMKLKFYKKNIKAKHKIAISLEDHSLVSDATAAIQFATLSNSKVFGPTANSDRVMYLAQRYVVAI